MLYLRHGISFVYDPSAVRMNETTETGRTILEQLAADETLNGGFNRATAETAGHYRAMYANFIVTVRALQWVAE